MLADTDASAAISSRLGATLDAQEAKSLPIAGQQIEDEAMEPVLEKLKAYSADLSQAFENERFGGFWWGINKASASGLAAKRDNPDSI